MSKDHNEQKEPDRTASPNTLRTIKDFCHYLRLHKTADDYPAQLERAAKEDLSHERFLQDLLSAEASAKFERVVKLRLLQAKLPVLKTMDNFDWRHPTTIPKAKILAAFELGFLTNKEGLILIGPSGVGKTHLALALAYKAASRGTRTLFVRAVDMINHLIASGADHSLSSAMKVYSKPELLVIDEVGHLPFDKSGGEYFFNVISRRYEQGSVVLTTNRPFKDWGKIFHDNTLATGIIDRLVHHSDVIKIEGASYRVKDKKPQPTNLP